MIALPESVQPATSASTPPPIKLCESCRWWVAWRHQMPTHSGERILVGECRHRSPYVVIRPEPNDGGQRPVTKWPSTRSTDYCGSHAPAPCGGVDAGGES